MKNGEFPFMMTKSCFEFLVLDGFQAGLSWWLILERREMFREAFDDFTPAKVAKYASKNFESIMKAPGVVKNRAKIAATITNAQQFLKIQEEFGSFDTFIWQFVQRKTIQNTFTDLSEMPAETEKPRAMSRELKKRGFKFAGPTICYAFIQAAGLVNDHSRLLPLLTTSTLNTRLFLSIEDLEKS